MVRVALRGSIQEELAVSLAEMLRRIRSGESVDKSELEVLESRLSDLEDHHLRKHLLTVLSAIERGNYGESDILGKLISYDSPDISKILGALQEFSYEDPFDELEFKGIFNFWRIVLRSLSKEKGTPKSPTS